MSQEPVSSPGPNGFVERATLFFTYSLKRLAAASFTFRFGQLSRLFQLVPSSIAFAAMIAVTAFNGYMSWMQDSELLAVYSIVGGLSTPLLLSTGENHEVSLFLYLLMLDVAVLVLAIFRPWSRLLFGAFAGTVLFVAGWWLRFRLEAQKRDICFTAVGNGSYTLFYGDPTLTSPEYDYATLFTPDKNPVWAIAGQEQPNPGYRPHADRRPFTERHPALLWASLVITVIVLGTIALRSAYTPGRPA